MATWNVRTLLDGVGSGGAPRRKTALLSHELGRYDIDIAALSETRISGEGSLREGDYIIYWKGFPDGQPRMHGVGLAIKHSLMKNLTEEPTFISERLMTLRIPLVRNEYAQVISAYAPTLVAEEDAKDDFYAALSEVLRGTNPRDKIILLGDFNARVGSRRDLWGQAIGSHGLGKMNANGLRLLTLCTEYDLTITNTLFRLKPIHKTSWMHPRSRQWHLLDYVIVRSSQVREIRITRAMRGAECWTDHRLIISKMHATIRPPNRRSRRGRRIDCAMLKDPNKRLEFAAKSRVAVENTTADESTAVAQWDEFARKLLDAAEETLGTQRPKDRDWFSDNAEEIKAILKRKNDAHTATLRNPFSPHLRQRFTAARSEAQRRLRELENKWWQDLALEIQGYADTNNMQKFYDATKRLYGPQKRSHAPVRDTNGALIKDSEGIRKRWAEHFSTLLNHNTNTDHSILDELPTLPMKEDLDETPTHQEVMEAIRALKMNKAAGPDEVPSELLVHGGGEVHNLIHRIISEIWRGEPVPQSWKDANLITIYKNKGDRAECGNSRGIALLSTAGKILAKIVLQRIVKNITEAILPETQCGFRADRSTVDMVFSARQVIEKCREQHRDLYIAFVDLAKAFDSVDRCLLWKILEKCGCPPKIIDIVRQLHDGMNVRVKVSGDLSDPFAVSRGVKQGCTLAPVLFNTYVQCITLLLSTSVSENAKLNINYRTDRSLFELNKLKAKTKIARSSFNELQYADDCALLSHSPDDLQVALSQMAHLYERMGLQINVKKTEVMQFHAESREEERISLLGEELKNVSCFRYLGSNISANCSLDDEICYRIGQATAAFGRLTKRVFTNHDLSLATRIMVYQAVCISSLLYCSESWTLYRRQTKLLERFHMSSLQKILGITWRDKIPHRIILERTKCPSLEHLLKRNQLRWIGHVVRMPDNRLPKQLLYGELCEGRRSAGGQLKRFKDATKATMKACHIPASELEGLVQERSAWRSTVSVGLKRFEEERNAWLDARREKRHERRTRPNNTNAIPCPECGRTFAAQIGLRSHLRAHQRRRQAGRDGQAVIFDPEGPP